ncbi:hypothetical protein DYB32_009658 [Aphanomyces invadans]|uniref:Uncharacterized protein n=1 Tax=Aphanomyces invadans TaxID=157072 RepID=A0A418AJD6_9STRA|nr:hypothetical protein DYB32_009658 [Aphanomyces invadans]
MHCDSVRRDWKNDVQSSGPGMSHAVATCFGQETGSKMLVKACDSLLYNIDIDYSGQRLIFGKDHGVATRFRSFPNGADPEGLTVGRVIFTLDTYHVANDRAHDTVLQVGICPFVNGVPNCTKSDLPGRVPITDFDEIVDVAWYPTSPIVVDSSTQYWFVAFANKLEFENSPRWWLGRKEFNNDPNGDVVFAITRSPDGPWKTIADDEHRIVGCMRVVAN